MFNCFTGRTFQWTGDTAWLFNIHFMKLHKELIKPCSILLTSSLCSLTLCFTWALMYLKSPLRRFRASLYRNSTLLFSLCNRYTLISMHFWFLCDTLFCCIDLHNNIFNSWNEQLSNYGMHSASSIRGWLYFLMCNYLLWSHLYNIRFSSCVFPFVL